MAHPGHYLFDGFYSTMRGLNEYQRLHQVDFLRLISERGISEGTVVDLGCGNGNFLADLKERFPKLKVYGIDKEEYTSRLPKEELILGNVSRGIPQLKDGVADLVVSTTVTPWMNGDALEGFYVEANRLLRDSGYGFVFPLGSNRVIQEKGISFIKELGFDKPVNFRKVKTPQWVDGTLPGVIQIVFGDVDKLQPYFL